MGAKMERTCPVCGNGYLADTVRLKYGRQSTCGRACSYRLRGQQKKARVDCVCATCGQHFNREPSHVKGKHGGQFCSRECHYAGRAFGVTRRVVAQPYRYTQDGLAAMSKAAARAYASGLTFPHPKTELAALALLVEHGVAAIHQHVIDIGDRSVAVDFFLPGRDLVIEVDSPDTHRRANRKCDAERDAALMARGLVVRRVPDDGVPEHVARAVLLAAVG